MKRFSATLGISLNPAWYNHQTRVAGPPDDSTQLREHHVASVRGVWEGREELRRCDIWGTESGDWVHRFQFPAPLSDKKQLENGKQSFVTVVPDPL